MSVDVVPTPEGMYETYALVLDGRARGDALVDAVTFFHDPHYLGRRVDPVRFRNQRTILKCFYGLKDQLTEQELEWLEELKEQGLTNWDPEHEGEFTILILEVGQRSGKSFLCSGIGLYEYYRWQMHENPHITFLEERGKRPIATGAPIEIKMVATSQDNARDHVFAETEAFIRQSGYFRHHLRVDRDIKGLFITGRKGVNIRAGPCTAGALRGGTSLCSVCDELSWMIDTSGRVGGKEVFRAQRNSTKTMDGKIILISSPCHEDDELHKLGLLAKNERYPGALWFNLPTWLMDPSQTREDYSVEEETDPESFERDFLAKAAAPLEAFFRDSKKLDRFLNRLPFPGGIKPPEYGVRYSVEREYHYRMRQWLLNEYEYEPGCRYWLWGDPAVKNDAFGYCIAHLDRQNDVIIDLAGRFIPDPKAGREIDAQEVKTFFVQVAQKLDVVTYGDDGWGFQEARQKIREEGPHIKEEKLDLARCNAAKEAIYDQTGAAQCYPLPQLRREMVGIELVNGKRIEMPEREGEIGHGDIAAAVVHCIADMYDPKKRTGGLSVVTMD